MQERISKKQLMELYGVNRTTIEEWRKKFELPMIEISSLKKYIRRENLMRWENQMKNGKYELELNNSVVS
jgi:predicted site-specific integrase-resolvase